MEGAKPDTVPVARAVATNTLMIDEKRNMLTWYYSVRMKNKKDWVSQKER